MKKFLALLAAVTVASVALAQINVVGVDRRDVIFFADTVEDDDTGVASESPILWVKYTGTQVSGTVDLNANALEFFAGTVGGETNALDGSDVNTGDVCGTANNALDVTDPQCDTPEELCQVINDAAANWICALAGVTQDETLATAAEYVDPADAQAKLPGGLGIFIDSTDVDSLALLMRPDVGYAKDAEMRNTNDQGHGDIEFFYLRPDQGAFSQSRKENPFAGLIPVLTYANAIVDSTAAWTITVWARRYNADGSVEERQVYSSAATVDNTLEELDFREAPLVGAPGETFLIEVVDDALVTARISASGMFIRDR